MGGFKQPLLLLLNEADELACGEPRSPCQPEKEVERGAVFPLRHLKQIHPVEMGNQNQTPFAQGGILAKPRENMRNC